MTRAADFTDHAVGARITVAFDNVIAQGRVTNVGSLFFRTVIISIDGPLTSLWLPRDFEVTVDELDLRAWALREPDGDIRGRLIEEYVDRCLPDLHEAVAL